MIFLTGANGHLGANLLRRLLTDGQKVRVFLRPTSDNSTVDGLDVEHAYGDLRDAASIAAAIPGCDRVYHCAAKVSTLVGEHKEIWECNVLGTRNLLQAARSAGVQRVVVSGSFSAVGRDPARPSDETFPFNPFDTVLPYGHSKACVEHECLKAVVDGLDVVVAVSCAILGPYDFKPSRMGRVLLDYANGRLRAYIPGGFEFVSAQDIVQGHILSMEKGRTGHKYIFSTQFLSIDELMDLYAQITGRARHGLRLPPALMAVVAEMSTFVLTNFFPSVPQRFTPAAVRLLRMNRRADCSKAKRELGYEPGSISEAIRQAYEWFVRQGRIAHPTRAIAGVSDRGIRVASTGK